MLLTAFIENHYFPHNPSTKPGTIRLHKIAIKKLGQFLGRPPTLDDLNNDTIGKFLLQCMQSGLAPATVNTQRSKLLALWRHANTMGLIRLGPLVKQIKEPDRLPTALTVDQLNQLILNFDNVQGETGGLSNSSILRACFAIQFYTGARIGEVRQLEWRDISGNTITFRAEIRKCGRRSLVRTVPQTAIRTLDGLKKKDRRIFPELTQNKIAIIYGRLFDLAQVDRPKFKTSHLLRSTHATLVNLAGGDASASLGHCSPATTQKSYLDPRFGTSEFTGFLPDLSWPDVG